METNVLISIYAAVLVISTCFAGLLWYAYKHELLKLIFLFWLTGIAAFICQGVAGGSDLAIFLSFSTNVFSLLVLMRMFAQACDLKVPWRSFSLTIALGWSLSTGLLLAGVEFTAATLPFALAFGFVMIYGAIFLRGDEVQQERQKGSQHKSQTLLARGFRLLILLNGVHFFDFPFLRPRADMAVLGFSIALMFFFCYAIYIPIFIMKSISDGYTDKLKLQVAERTRELSRANEALVNLNSSLETKNEELKTLGAENVSLLNVVVHDLATPLMVLAFETQRLEGDNLSEIQVRSAIRITKAAASIDATVQHTRALHAQRIGKKQRSIGGRANLQAIFQGLLADYDEKLREKKLCVELNVSDDVHVNGDEERLKHQVFGNLLSNAIKFSHAGGKIEFVASRTDGKVVIHVRDQGVGISPDRQRSIFDSDEPTSTVGTHGEVGTGLGLPIVRQYARLMGGSVQVLSAASALSTGTCFEVVLQAAS